MQISDLLQAQSAVKAGQPSSGPSTDAGKAPAATAAPAAAAAEGFGAQLRRAIQRQASAAATDAPPQRRPEPAVDLGELAGLEPLDAAGTETDAADAGSPVQATSAAFAFDLVSARPSTPRGPDADRSRSAFPGQAFGVEGPGTFAGQMAVENADALVERPVLRTGPGHEGPQGPQPPRAEFSVDEAARLPRQVVYPMPSTADVLRSTAVRVASSVPSGTADPSAAVAAVQVERLTVASAARPAVMRRPGGDVLIGAGLPAAPPPVTLSSQASEAVETDARAGVLPGAFVAANAAGPQGLRRQPALQSPPLPGLQAREQPVVPAVTVARSPLPLGMAVGGVSAAAVGLAASPASSPGLVGRAEVPQEQASAGLGLGLAAPTQAPVQGPLRTAALGPAMDLIVGEEPEPGLDALLAYARRSGFSPQALQKLFGPDTGPAAGLTPGASSASTPTSVSTSAAVSGQPLPAAAQPVPSDPGVLSMAAWIGGRAGISATGVRSTPAPVAPLSAAAPVSERTDVVAASVARIGGGDAPVAAGMPVSTAPAAPGGTAGPTGVSPAMVSVPGGAAPASHADLAHRLAQATATRMVAELRQGNGSLRLQIEPASLGKVDIDMTLRQGSLEATLIAHQAVTRELLVDGLPRLRDTLAQLGMNVAGVDIRSGFSGQNDGKSTKQQNREVWYSARRGSVVGSTSPVDGGDQRRSSKLDIWA